MTITIRPAIETDLPAILAIHNHHIAHTLAIWRYQLADLAERRTWFEERRAKDYPVLAAEEEGETVGFASYGPFRAGEGYHRTVENSIYVRPDRQGRGHARRLMEALIAEARAQERHVMVAGIGLPNEPSVKLHTGLGFVEAGRLQEIGWKFGNPLDLLLMQLRL